MARPREYDDSTRDALIDAASRRLASGGPDAVTLRDVAGDVGATTAAIYALFGSKTALLRAVYRAGFAGLAAELEAVPPTSDPLLDLYELGLAYRRSALARPTLYRVMFTAEAPTDLVGVGEDPVAASTLERLRAGVARCQAAGLLPGTDPSPITVQLWAVVHGLALLELRGALGSEHQATRHWHETLVAIAAGYRGGAERTRPRPDVDRPPSAR